MNLCSLQKRNPAKFTQKKVSRHRQLTLVMLNVPRDTEYTKLVTLKLKKYIKHSKQKIVPAIPEYQCHSEE